MRVLLAGGGSGGSAAPVIAVAEELRERHPEAEFLYVGTRGGPERVLVEAAGLPFAAVAAGRFRRYRTWRNLVDPSLVLAGIGQALWLVQEFHPTIAFGAGGFATVPPLLAARLVGAPIMIHQQDALPSLANRMLAPFAAKISVCFAVSEGRFRRPTLPALGNPVRRAILGADPALGRARLGLAPELPLVLAMGGGTGALGLNRLVVEAAHELVADAEIVHLTGAGKASSDWSHPGYQSYEFLAEDFPDVLAAANLVVSRSGMSSLAELGALRKAAIVVPMPDSHQELNAALLAGANAAVVLAEAKLTPAGLVESIRKLLASPEQRQALGAHLATLLPPDASERVAIELAALARS